MIDTPVSQHDDRLGDARPASHLVGREAEMDRLHSFLVTAETHGGASLVTGEPGVGADDLVESSDRLRLPAVPSRNRDDGDLSDGRVTLLALYRAMAGTHATIEILDPSTRPRADAAGHADREGG